MLLRSGKTYSLDHLNMESKLDLILKELQDLRLRIEGLENKNKEENSRDNTRDKREENTNRRKNEEDDIICRIKINPLTFDGTLDSKIFSDWMTNFDYYFDWYKFTEEGRIRFAKMRLLGSVRICWTLVEKVH